MLPVVAIDFDGVLHLRPRSEKGAIDVTGDAVPGAMNFLYNLSHAASIIIFSARFNGYDGVEAMHNVREWVLKQMQLDNEARAARGKTVYSATAVVDGFKWTAVKPVCRVYLDDRCICFKGTFPPIPDLLYFRAWTESSSR